MLAWNVVVIGWTVWKTCMETYISAACLGTFGIPGHFSIFLLLTKINLLQIFLLIEIREKY